MKIGATKITELLVASVFPIPRHVCVANVSWSLLPYEADLLAMTTSGYLIEVEVKISLSDLKRDAGKNKWRWTNAQDKISRFYYAMPEALWDKPAAKECVRPGAGVIVIRHTERGLVAETVIEAVRTTARPLSPRDQFDLARVGSYRAWSPQQKHRRRQLLAEHKLEEQKRSHRWKDFLLKQEAKP